MKNICFFTATRAEYGLLRPLIKAFQANARFKVDVIVSGTHLAPEYGMTVDEIVADEIPVTRRVEMLLSSDSRIGVAKSMGLAVSGVAEALEQLKPELLFILGDRYEALGAASAAAICNIPIAHIHGGEITEGAVDDSMRHAITKLATIHFTSTEEYRKRVIQMGEDPSMVHCVGALGIDNIRCLKLETKKQLFEELKISGLQPHLVVTFHPVTRMYGEAGEQIDSLLEAMSRIQGYTVIYTSANSDVEGREINTRIKAAVTRSPNTHFFASLGQVRYLSALATAYAVVGNSSSGIIEAPALHIPTVNIGTRQNGRIKPESVIDCSPDAGSIETAIHTVLTADFKNKCALQRNPYGDGFAAENIIKTISQDHGAYCKKPFVDSFKRL